MKPSAIRVAHQHLLRLADGNTSIEDYIHQDFLPAVGAEIAKRLGGGTHSVEFNKGWLLRVRSDREEVARNYGIRVKWSRGCTILELQHAYSGEAPQYIGAMSYNDFATMKPRQVADWAVDAVQGSRQTELFLTQKERDKANWERADSAMREWAQQQPREPSWSKKQRKKKELFEQISQSRRI